MDILRIHAGVVIRRQESDRRTEQNTAYQVCPAHLRQHLLPISLSIGFISIRHSAKVVCQLMVCQHPQGVQRHFVQDFRHGIDLDAVRLQQADICTMFLGCFVHIEIVFKQTCRGMNDPIEQLLSGCMHQNHSCHIPLSPGVVHGYLFLLTLHCASSHDHRDTSKCRYKMLYHIYAILPAKVQKIIDICKLLTTYSYFMRQKRTTYSIICLCRSLQAFLISVNLYRATHARSG